MCCQFESFVCGIFVWVCLLGLFFYYYFFLKYPLSLHLSSRYKLQLLMLWEMAENDHNACWKDLATKPDYGQEQSKERQGVSEVVGQSP